MSQCLDDNDDARVLKRPVSCPTKTKKESNGPTDAYAAIAQVDVQRQEPESLRKWREEQKKRLEELGEPRISQWGLSQTAGASSTIRSNPIMSV